MRKPGEPRTLAERWADDEEMLAETPLAVDVQPRWVEDDLPQYGPSAPVQPSSDDLKPDDL